MKPIIIITFSFVFIFISCGSRTSKLEESTESYDDHYSAEYEEDATGMEKNIDRSETIEQKIIKEAWIDIEVKNYETAIEKIKKSIKNADAYISKENEYKSDISLTNQLTIRVPKSNFDTLIEAIIAFADIVERKNIEAKDVTEEYVDIEARLKTKKAVEQRYIELLRQARNVSDVLNVERELKSIREEIESAEGRLKYFDNRIGYSTIYLEVTKEFPTASNFRFFSKFKDGLGIGWKVFLNIILALVYIWPLLIIGFGIWWYIRRRRRKKRKAKEENNKN